MHSQFDEEKRLLKDQLYKERDKQIESIVERRLSIIKEEYVEFIREREKEFQTEEAQMLVAIKTLES